MKRANIYLDEEQARTLRRLAIEEKRSFTDIVREALNEYVVRRGLSTASTVLAPPRQVPEDEWQERMQTILRRMRSGASADERSADVEADITAAWTEVRTERLGREA